MESVQYIGYNILTFQLPIYSLKQNDDNFAPLVQKHNITYRLFVNRSDIVSPYVKKTVIISVQSCVDGIYTCIFVYYLDSKLTLMSPVYCNYM